jgi:site-specific DNA-cytosine methylase
MTINEYLQGLGTAHRKAMNILVACEESQAVTIELRRLGHKAYSCDIIPCSGGHPEWHIMQDVLPLLDGNCEFVSMDGKAHIIEGKWDMIIAFPPCTHLANSGARSFEQKRKDGRQARAIRFFASILAAECERVAVENPVGIISGQYILEHFPKLCEEMGLPIKPTQVIQPWQFALTDAEKTEKTTCIWLKGLPKLKPLYDEKPEIQYKEWFDEKTGRTKRQTQWYYDTRCLGPGKRATAASKTFPGIAKAMAEQWAGECK